MTLSATPSCLPRQTNRSKWPSVLQSHVAITNCEWTLALQLHMFFNLTSLTQSAASILSWSHAAGCLCHLPFQTAQLKIPMLHAFSPLMCAYSSFALQLILFPLTSAAAFQKLATSICLGADHFSLVIYTRQTEIQRPV